MKTAKLDTWCSSKGVRFRAGKGTEWEGLGSKDKGVKPKQRRNTTSFLRKKRAREAATEKSSPLSLTKREKVKLDIQGDLMTRKGSSETSTRRTLVRPKSSSSFPLIHHMVSCCVARDLPLSFASLTPLPQPHHTPALHAPSVHSLSTSSPTSSLCQYRST